VSGRASGEVERLWLAALEKLTGNVAHELRNALNGVAVNLEVVRSRSAREGVAASALGSYAASASEQLEQVIAMTDALMALTRAADGSAAVGRIADRVAALVRPPLVAAGGSLELAVEGDGMTKVPVEAARLFIAAALQCAVETAGGEGGGAKGKPVVLAVAVRPAGAVALSIEGKFRTPPQLDDAVSQLATEYGVGIHPTESSITLTFPA
jgi:signal transduction histidine kinase